MEPLTQLLAQTIADSVVSVVTVSSIVEGAADSVADTDYCRLFGR